MENRRKTCQAPDRGHVSKSVNQDLLSGLLFLVLSGAAIYLLWGHPMMQGSRIGTGYFPKILITLLAGMSVALIIKGLLGQGGQIALERFRPVFFVIASFVIFGLLVRVAGFFFASMASVVTACLADDSYRPMSIFLISLVLATAATVLFVGLIQIPVRVFPW